MSDSTSKGSVKGGEQELSEVVAWLRNEFAGVEQQKKDKLLQAAKKLKELGFRSDRIASTLAEYADILGVSRSYIYDSLPDEFKSKRRSEAQKDAKNSVSPVSDSESEVEPIVVGSDGHSFGDNLTDDDSNESATNTWKAAAATRNETLDAWIPAVTTILESAVIDGDFVRIPKEVWEQFKQVADALF